MDDHTNTNGLSKPPSHVQIIVDGKPFYDAIVNDFNGYESTEFPTPDQQRDPVPDDPQLTNYVLQRRRASALAALGVKSELFLHAVSDKAGRIHD